MNSHGPALMAGQRRFASVRAVSMYYKEDHRIPVPMREREAAMKVVDFFKTRLEKHLDWYTALLPDDDPISLFGKDSF
jgi:hypothetical protein